MRRVLYLVAYDPAVHRAGFEKLAARVGEQAPDIVPRVIVDRRYRGKRLAWTARRSLFVSVNPLERLRPLRGAVFAGQRLAKSEELAALVAKGVRVPRWRCLRAGTAPDLDGFGEYVVIKPEFGLRGAHVRIKRRTRVRGAASGAEAQAEIAQEFIYTGPWPTSYRVSTLFGEVLYALRADANPRRRPLDGPDKWRGAGGGGRSIVATARDGTWRFDQSGDVLAVGRAAAAAFPDVPKLGIDIVRCHATGALYVLEVNAFGWTWHFTSSFGSGLREQFGIELASQFDGLNKAARILVDATRRHAR